MSVCYKREEKVQFQSVYEGKVLARLLVEGLCVSTDIEESVPTWFNSWFFLLSSGFKKIFGCCLVKAAAQIESPVLYQLSPRVR